MARDPEKVREAKRRWYQANKQVYRDRNKRQYLARKEYVDNLKGSSPCKDCGVRYPFYVMDFDHLGDKAHLVSRLVTNGGMQRMLDEIAKCDIVCANCHRERTHRRLSGMEDVGKLPRL